MSRSRRLLFAALAALVAALAVAWRRGRRAVPDGLPLSPLRASGRVGADWPERAGVTGDGPAPRGEMDDLAHYARSDFEPGRVAPAVREFYERTGDYAFRATVEWDRGFRLGAAAAARLTDRVEQLNLPGPFEDGDLPLDSEFRPLSSAADPRDDGRLWVRTDGSGAAVFVAAYASHERDGERFVNIAVPLPGGNLSTVLRVTHLDGGGLELSTRADHPDPGLYLVTPWGPVRLPMAQRFRVWPADDPAAPAVAGDADVVATHEMWVLGRRFLRVTYAAAR